MTNKSTNIITSRQIFCQGFNSKLQEFGVYTLRNIPPTQQKIAKTAIFAATTVGPTGVESSTEAIIPVAAHTTDTAAEDIITDLKVLNTLIDESAGKMTSAEMRSEPTSFIASTIIIALITATARLK